MLQEMKRCEHECIMVQEVLPGGILHQYSYCFPLKGDWFLSSAVPIGAMGNRVEDEQEYPRCLETALLENKGLRYVSEWGYKDVQRFYGATRASEPCNIKKVQNEIKRLKLFIK